MKRNKSAFASLLLTTVTILGMSAPIIYDVHASSTESDNTSAVSNTSNNPADANSNTPAESGTTAPTNNNTDNQNNSTDTNDANSSSSSNQSNSNGSINAGSSSDSNNSNNQSKNKGNSSDSNESNGNQSNTNNNQNASSNSNSSSTTTTTSNPSQSSNTPSSTNNTSVTTNNSQTSNTNSISNVGATNTAPISSLGNSFADTDQTYYFTNQQILNIIKQNNPAAYAAIPASVIDEALRGDLLRQGGTYVKRNKNGFSIYLNSAIVKVLRYTEIGGAAALTALVGAGISAGSMGLAAGVSLSAVVAIITDIAAKTDASRGVVITFSTKGALISWRQQ